MRRFGVDRKLMTYRQVAEQGFGQTVGWLYRHMAKLQEMGFPKPLIGRKFDPAAIDAWMNQVGPAKFAAADKFTGTGEGDDADPLQTDRGILKARLLELQGGRA